MKTDILTRQMTVLAVLAMTAAGGTATAGDVWEVPRTVGDLVVEPSPEVAALNRYVDSPVNFASGRADVSVPLFSWECGDLSVSLGLSYNTSAVRTDDTSGWIGLGWSLTGLGSVSRSVNGLPDEGGTGFTHDFRTRESEMDTGYLTDVVENRADALPDRYHYSFPGYSGSFVIDGDRIIQMPPTELKIEREAAQNNAAATAAFIITAPDGTSYRFAETESTEV